MTEVWGMEIGSGEECIKSSLLRMVKVRIGDSI